MTGPGKDEKGARGFEGLGDLLSDETETPSRPDSTGRATRAPRVDEPPPLPEEPPPLPPPLPPSSRGPAAADTNRGAPPPLPAEVPSQKSVPWGWIAAAAIGVLIVLANLNDEADAPSIASSNPPSAFETPSSPGLPATMAWAGASLAARR